MESMNLIINAASNIASTISEKLTQRPSSPVVTRMDVVAQEEAERNIREIHPAQARLRMDNAKRVSSLVSGGPHAFAVQPLKGFRAITNKLEEAERERRINTKAEYAIRRSNAAKVAGIVKSLGWPFYHHDLHKGTKIIVISPSILAEEEERQRRLSDPFSIMTAKHNAAIVSSLIRWNGPSKPATARRYTRMLEEKERKQRITDSQSAEYASANAMQVSQLIRNIGFPFYKGEIYQAGAWTNTHVLEEKERDRRMASSSEQQLARETAGEIARMLPTPTFRLNDLEEKERSRRMRIHNGENARAEAQLIQRVLSDDTITGAHVRRLVGLAAPVRSADGLRFNKQSIIAQEERERDRRMHDPSGQIRSMNLARSASRLIAKSFSTEPAAPLSPVETERQRRMYDRKGKLTSMRNARKVAAMVTNCPRIPLKSVPAPIRRPLSPVEEEEMERVRRVRDVSGQMLARSNAMQVSGLVIGNQKKRSLQHSNSESAIQRPVIVTPASRLAAAPMTIPASPMPFSPIAEAHDLPKTPVVTFQACPEMVLTPSLPAPVVKKLAASIQQTAVDPSSVVGVRAPPGFGAVPTHAPRAATRSLQHSSSAPNLVGRVAPSPTTAQRAIPISSALFSRVPLLGAPVPAGSAATTCGEYKYVTPVYPPAITHAGQPVRSALRNASISAPSASTHSSPTHSVTFAPLPERSTPAAMVYDKPYTFPAPQPSYATASAAPLSMGAYPPPKGLKKMEKTAFKHQKLADKAARRSVKDQAKADKLHLKGKDMRAVRYQTKAEQSAAAAAHHSAYAMEYKKDIYAPVAPATSTPGVLAAGSPMM